MKAIEFSDVLRENQLMLIGLTPLAQFNFFSFKSWKPFKIISLIIVTLMNHLHSKMI